jgi:hypothetical protein
MSQYATATSWSIWPRTGNFLLQWPDGRTKFVAVTQNLSQKLTSEGNVDPTNAAALLHALCLGPTKDVTMCYCHLMVHLAKDRQLFAAEHLILEKYTP